MNLLKTWINSKIPQEASHGQAKAGPENNHPGKLAVGNSLRDCGPIDAPKFKVCILPLIFLKRLSDVFEDELNQFGDHCPQAADPFQ